MKIFKINKNKKEDSNKIISNFNKNKIICKKKILAVKIKVNKIKNK
jgi:hypothetical protein